MDWPMAAKKILNETTNNTKERKKDWMSDFRHGRGVSVNYFKHNAWLIVLFVLAIVMLIGLRYNTKTNMMKIKELNTKLEQAENRKLAEKAQYMSLIRESDMVKLVNERHLGLEFQEQPPYELTVNE
jgi:hypothetical protein